MSQAILRFCTLYNIQHQITAAYHPQSNGKAERMIQTLKKNVRKLQLNNQRDFTRALQIAVAAYCMVPHRATGFSPFQLLYGCDLLMPEELPFTTYNSDEDYEIVLSTHIEKMLKTIQQAMLNNQNTQKKTRKWFDRNFFL